VSYPVILTPQAERQLDELFARIAADSGAARADAYVDRIVARCMSLATFPARGTPRDDLRPGLRIVGFERRVTIAFAMMGGEVVVHGVFYGGQDLEPLASDPAP